MAEPLKQSAPSAAAETLAETAPWCGLAAGAVANDPRVGCRLGKYLLTSRLGQGGMGVVYEATDTVLKRLVAVKLLRESVVEAEAWRRVLREAQATARLNHPNVVTVYDSDVCGGTCYLVMELVRGPSAQDLLRTGGALPWQEATRLITETCRGLAAAHAAGVIHRDLKPANILRSCEGVVKLADFGLARAAGLSATSHQCSAAGTSLYMSPEQCRGESLDGRSDLYALGATYYALLVGHPPYQGNNPYDLMFAHCSRPIPDARADNPQVPEGCAVIVRRAMAKYPVQRYGTATEMLAALEAILAPAKLSLVRTTAATPPACHGAAPGRQGPLPRGPFVLGVVLGAALFGAGLYLRQSEAVEPPPGAAARAGFPGKRPLTRPPTPALERYPAGMRYP